MLRINRGFNYCSSAGSFDNIGLARGMPDPGPFIVDEVSRAAELLPSGHSCRRWGTAIRHPDGQVTLRSRLTRSRGRCETAHTTPVEEWHQPVLARRYSDAGANY